MQYLYRTTEFVCVCRFWDFEVVQLRSKPKQITRDVFWCVIRMAVTCDQIRYDDESKQ